MAPLQCALAWSLHAADDAIRRRLVPTQTDDVEQLRDAFVRLLAHRGPGHHLFVEVTLLKGINDSVEDATKLARLLEPLRASGSDAKVNLLAYNDNMVQGLAATGEEQMTAFRDVVMRAGFVCTIRYVLSVVCEPCVVSGREAGREGESERARERKFIRNQGGRERNKRTLSDSGEREREKGGGGGREGGRVR